MRVIGQPFTSFRVLADSLTNLLDGSQITELALCFLARGFWRQALPDEIFGFRFEVEAKFFLHIGRRIRAEKPRIAPPERSGCHQASSGSGSRVVASTFATATAYASQILTS